MIIKINGQSYEEWRESPREVKSETFNWSPVKREPQQLETVSQQYDRLESCQRAAKGGSAYETVRERAKRTLKPVLQPAVPVINLLSTIPLTCVNTNHTLASSVPFSYQYGLGGALGVPEAMGGGAATIKGMGLAAALQPVIAMLQELALPVGIGMAIWGLIEVIIGNPGGKDKLKWSLIGYAGVFVVPFFFFQIRNAFSTIPIA